MNIWSIGVLLLACCFSDVCSRTQYVNRGGIKGGRKSEGPPIFVETKQHSNEKWWWEWWKQYIKEVTDPTAIPLIYPTDEYGRKIPCRPCDLKTTPRYDRTKPSVTPFIVTYRPGSTTTTRTWFHRTTPEKPRPPITTTPRTTTTRKPWPTTPRPKVPTTTTRRPWEKTTTKTPKTTTRVTTFPTPVTPSKKPTRVPTFRTYTPSVGSKTTPKIRPTTPMPIPTTKKPQPPRTTTRRPLTTTTRRIVDPTTTRRTRPPPITPRPPVRTTTRRPLTTTTRRVVDPTTTRRPRPPPSTPRPPVPYSLPDEDCISEGPPVKVPRPDRPRPEMPTCALSGKHFCILTDDYPADLVNRAVDKSSTKVRILYEELQAVADPELFRHFHGNDSASRGSFACETEADVMRPGWAQESVSGDWLVVVNTDLFPQKVRTESCKRPNEPCSFVSSHYESTCQQRYSLHRLLAVYPHDPNRSPVVALFKFPAGCSCRVDPVIKDNQHYEQIKF